MRQLHDCHTRFESLVVLRAKLIEKLGDQVPNTITFDIGYYDGQAHSKIWLCSHNDLEAMYRKHPTREITLWCDGCMSEEEAVVHGKRKRADSSTGTSKRQKKEEEVDSVFEELKETHGSRFDTPHLRLWARMVASKIHDDLKDPPNIPAFNSTPRQQSVSSAISGAAIALTKVLGGTPSEDNEGTTTCRQTGVSPGKTIELRMKNYEQLRYLQQLFDDSILSETEYIEQKQGILASLRKL